MGLLRPIGCAQAATAGSSGSSAELDAFLAALPKWSTSSALTAGYGYKDNLFLSSEGEAGSAFIRGSAEFLLLKVPTGQFDFSFSVWGERTQFLSSFKTDDRTFDHEAKVWIRTEPAYRLGGSWKFGLPVTGYYYDQVFVVSDIETERDVAEFKVKGAMVGPVVRWDFRPDWWLEAQGIGQRKRYDDGANDGTIGEGALRLGWTVKNWLEIRLAGMRRWRDFDHRHQYGPSGRELSEPLKISEREGEARFDITWDNAERWTTTTRFNLLHYQDNGSGYFNYREQRVSHDLAWKGDLWLVRGGGSAGRLDFSVQKGETGNNPPLRLKDEFMVELHIERKLGSQWTLFGEYSWERSRSNEDLASYRVNEGLLGARWSWEK